VPLKARLELPEAQRQPVELQAVPMLLAESLPKNRLVLKVSLP